MTSLLVLFLTNTLSAQSVSPTPTSIYYENGIIGNRILEQLDRIQRRYAAGAITQQQVITLKAQVRAVKTKKETFLKQNHVLTTAQVNQLNAMLDNTSQQIGGTPGVAPQRHILNHSVWIASKTPTVQATQTH